MTAKPTEAPFDSEADRKGPRSTKALFRATKAKRDGGLGLMADLPVQIAPGTEARDPLDYDPTPEDATEAFLAAEADHIRHALDVCTLPFVWEPAVGGGHIARVLERWEFDVIGSDIVDRGYDYTGLRDFYSWEAAPARVAITNPPYGEISSRDGHGRWLLKCFELELDYVALLLGAEWPFARKNGFDRLFAEHPPSVEYACCWKIDFRGQGNPAHRNSWFVWDRHRPALGPNTWIRKRLYNDPVHRDQASMELDP